jgi:hypothetical protein
LEEAVTKRGDLLLNIKKATGFYLMVIITIFILLMPATCLAQTVKVSGISLDLQNITLLWGEEQVVTATLRPGNATDQRVSWESSNYAVLSLDAFGKSAYITAVGPGESVVTAISVDGRYVASCTVTVIKPVTSIAIDQELVQLAPGETFQIEAWVEPLDASEPGIIWESSDNGVASVDEKGLIKAKSIGEARIIARTVENREISVFTTVMVSAAPQTGETDGQTNDPSMREDVGIGNDLDPDDTAPNYFLYILIATLIIVAALLYYVLQRRSGDKSAPFVSTSGRLPVLRGISGIYNRQKFSLNTGPLVIGRDPHLARVVYPPDHDQISRRHLTIYFDPATEAFYAEDSSSNGTFLSGGDRLSLNQRQPIQRGETLTLANTEETFVVELE